MEIFKAAQTNNATVVKKCLSKGTSINCTNDGGCTPLFLACEYNSVSVVEFLLSQGADTEVREKEDQDTALIRAAYNNHSKVVELLVEHGASVNSQDKYGETAVWFAAFYGYEQVVSVLLTHNVDVNRVKYEHKTTPLYVACQNNHSGVVKLLLQHGADVNSQRTDGVSPLYVSAEKGHVDVVSVLLQHGADVNSQRTSGASALHISAQNGHVDVVSVLLQHGADVNSQSTSGASALFISSQNGHVDVVSVLLQHGADVNSQSTDGVSSLYISAQCGHVDVVSVLLQHGADVNSQCTDGSSPLYISSQNGHVDVVSVLLQHGADVNSQRTSGVSALYISAENGHVDVVSVLLQHGADVNLSMNNGNTPLYSAVWNGHAAVVDTLLAYKADINSRGFDGQTPLLRACLENQLEVVELLCSKGADISAQRNDGDTSLHIAVRENLLEVTKVLLRYGATLITNKDGLTPLDIAKRKKSANIIALLELQGSKHQLKGELEMFERKNQQSSKESRVRGKHVKQQHEEYPQSQTTEALMIHGGATAQTTAQGYPADHEKEIQSSSALVQPQSLVKKMLPIDMTEIYTKQDREKLVGYQIFILVPLGETMAGKTTLLRTIKAMASCLTREDERTNLAEVSSWSPEEQPEVLFMLYDVGGHESYKNTTHIFQVDSSLMISLICHDITTDECNTTMFWIKMCQMNAPNSKMQILLTKVDKITQQEREDRKTSFVKEFTDLLDKEIQMTESNKEKTKSLSKKEVFERHLVNYRDLKKQIEQTLFLEVSCVPGWEDSVNGVTRCLLEFADKQKHLVMLNPIEKELFVRIGKLGIKQRMIEPQMAGADTSKNTENKGMQVGSKMSGTDESNNSGNKNMHKGVQMTGAEKSVKSKKAPVGDDRPHSTDLTHSTDTNVQPFSTKDQKVNTMQQQFLTFSEVLEVFKPIFKKYYPNCQQEQLQKELKKSLSNLKQRGLLRHFTGDKDLENIIFHDISTLVSILRSIFHHDLQTSLTYQLAHRHYNNRLDFKRDILSLSQHGILSMTLLEHLLQQSNCLISATIVAKLLSSLDVGIIFTDDTSKKNKVFIPYFLENVQAPEDIEKKKEDITTCKENFLALQTVVDTNAPTTFFNQLMIKVYQTLQRVLPFRKAVHIWSQGLFVSLDEHRGKLMLYHNAQNEVEFFISADVTHIDGHHLLWEYVQLIDTSFLNIQECKFPGLPGVYILKCTECCLTGSTDIYEFFVHEMLNPDIQPKESFSCGDTSDLPRALISPMPKDEAKQKRCHESLLTYLKEHCPSKEKPRGGPRLGMTETSSAQTFSESFRQHREATGVTFTLLPEQIIDTTTPLLSTLTTRVTCHPHGQTSVASIFSPTQTVGTALPPHTTHSAQTCVTSPLHPVHSTSIPAPLYSTQATIHPPQTTVTSLFDSTQSPGLTSLTHPLEMMSVTSTPDSSQITSCTSFFDPIQTTCVTYPIYPTDPNLHSTLNSTQAKSVTSVFDSTQTTGQTSLMHPTEIRNITSTINSTETSVKSLFVPTQTTDLPSPVRHTEMRSVTSTLDSIQIDVISPLYPRQITCLPSPVLSTQTTGLTSLNATQTCVTSLLHPIHSTGISPLLNPIQAPIVTTPLHSTQTTSVTYPLHPTLTTCETSTLQPTLTSMARPFYFPQTTGVTYPPDSIQTTDVTSPIHPAQPSVQFPQTPDGITIPQTEDITEARPPANAEQSEYFAETSAQPNQQTIGVTYPPDSMQTPDVTAPIHPAQPDVRFPQTPDDISIPQIEDNTEARPPTNAEQSEYLAGTLAQPNQQTIGVTYPPDSIQTPDVTSPINHAQPEVQFPQTPDDISIPQTNDNTEARPLANAEQSEYLAGTSAQPSQQVVQLFSDLRSGLRSDMATYMLRLSNQVFAQGQVMAHHVHQTVALQSGDASSLPLNLQHPALRALKDELVQGMNVNAELLMCCISSGLLTEIDKISILNDNNPLGRAKRLLLKVDSQGYGGPDNLVTALRQCGGSNKRLADTLNDTLRGCYMPDP